MDIKDKPEEIQDPKGFKDSITNAPGIKRLNYTGEEPLIMTTEEVQKNIDDYINETDKLVNPVPPLGENEFRVSNPDKISINKEEENRIGRDLCDFQQLTVEGQPVEKVIFIALKEDPKLINKLNDFLRIHSLDDEIYKVLVINKDITQKLFETYWFGKLSEEEQKMRQEQLQDESWKQGAQNLANNLFEVLSSAGYEKHDFQFSIRELKQEYVVVRKIKLNAASVKQMIDTLLVFGYITQINEEKAFNKLRFQLVHTDALKLKYIEKQILELDNEVEYNQTLLLSFYNQKENLLQLMKDEPAAATSTTTDTE